MPSMKSFTERELLMRMKSDDKDAFNEIYERYYSRLRNYALKFVKAPQYTEDIIQDTFLKLWEIRENIDPDNNFNAYIFTIIRNLIFKFLKSVAHNTDILNDVIISSAINDTDSGKLLESRELINEIRHAISMLPPRRQEIFVLCRDKNMSYKEVAARLDISRNTIKEHMILSMKFIKEHLIKCSLYQKAIFALLMITIK